MNFRQRLTRYLIGLGIGCVVVFLMYPQYDWLGWTPGKRIMKQIREVVFHTDPMASCQMNCIGINQEHIQLARMEGRVDFSQSNVNHNPKIYQLEYGNLKMKIALNDSLAVLKEVNINGTECNCP